MKFGVLKPSFSGGLMVSTLGSQARGGGEGGRSYERAGILLVDVY